MLALWTHSANILQTKRMALRMHAAPRGNHRPLTEEILLFLGIHVCLQMSISTQLHFRTLQTRCGLIARSIQPGIHIFRYHGEPLIRFHAY